MIMAVKKYEPISPVVARNRLAGLSRKPDVSPEEVTDAKSILLTANIEAAMDYASGNAGVPLQASQVKYLTAKIKGLQNGSSE